MNSITTKYTGSKYIAKSWNGSARVNVDNGLNSEMNHRAAALKLIRKLNENRDVQWRISSAAPLPASDGWVFLIDYAPELIPAGKAITVKFYEGTAKRQGYMKVFSWWEPKGRRVTYSREYIGWESTQGNAQHAALIGLGIINDYCAQHHDGWDLGVCVVDSEGSYHYSLTSVKVTK